MFGFMSSSGFADLYETKRRGRALAEFEEWSLIVAYHSEIDSADDLAMSDERARREVVQALAQGLKVSEHAIWAIILQARTLRERTPAVWEAFRAGDLDAARVSAIADTAERIETTSAWAELDHSAPEYAATCTIAELRAWLRRLRS